ncbi:MAG: hypothetical protein MMC33_009486, partial [Icmadophila ericetorum]|nr:hypothetical protein [Icmadophila ericetorum]
MAGNRPETGDVKDPEDASMNPISDESEYSEISTSDHNQDLEDDAEHENSEMSDTEDHAGSDEEDPEEDGEYDEFSSWRWLKAFHPKEIRDEKTIAGGRAFLIDREPIRDDFYTHMEEPVQELSDLAYELFDRFGRVKAEFIEHPCKKGTGIWGEELNRGMLLDFERISIDKNFRRQGIGKKLVMDLWAKVKVEVHAAIKPRFGLAQMFTPLTTEDEECAFALAWGTYLNTYEVDKEEEGLSEEAKEELHTAKEAEIIAFLRSIGFRRVGTSNWFALAADASHPAHSLPAESDYDPPLKTKTELPIHSTLRQASRFQPDNPFLFDDDDGLHAYRDQLLLSILQAHLDSHPGNDPSWKSLDERGNTILHRVVTFPRSLEWLLGRGLHAGTLHLRNHDGETGAERFESTLELKRTQKQYKLMVKHASDYFRGYGTDATRTLMRLRGLDNLSQEGLGRMSYGCTCGQCIEFLSPRVTYAIHTQAQILGDMLVEADKLTESPTGWVAWHGHLLEYVDPAIVNKFKTNKSLRTGFASLFHHIAACLSAKKLPTTTNVLAVLEKASEWPPYTKTFLQRGGTVSSAALNCFNNALEEDVYLGNSQHYLTFRDDIEKLPKCRNDHEFVMATRNYKALECGEHTLEGYAGESKWKSCTEGEDV